MVFVRHSITECSGMEMRLSSEEDGDEVFLSRVNAFYSGTGLSLHWTCCV